MHLILLAVEGIDPPATTVIVDRNGKQGRVLWNVGAPLSDHQFSLTVEKFVQSVGVPLVAAMAKTLLAAGNRATGKIVLVGTRNTCEGWCRENAEAGRRTAKGFENVVMVTSGQATVRAQGIEVARVVMLHDADRTGLLASDLDWIQARAKG